MSFLFASHSKSNFLDGSFREVDPKEEPTTELHQELRQFVMPPKSVADFSHDDLKEFVPGRDPSQHAIRWSEWLRVWDYYLEMRLLDEKEADATDGSGKLGDYKATGLRALFMVKIGEDGRRA